MKKIFLNLVTISLMFAVLPGCEKSKFLETEQLSSISEEAVWNDPALARALLLDIYKGLPSAHNRGGGWDGTIMDVFTDDAVCAWNFAIMPVFNQHSYNAANIPDWIYVTWTNNYATIRKANDFIAKADRLSDKALVKTMVAEARFLRAVLYFDLYRYYGGVPLVTVAQAFNEKSDVVRASDEETVKFITDELEAAAQDLPEDPWTGDDKGRADKSGALGMKAKAFLHAGKWAEAATAAKAVIDLAKYDLHPAYSDLFYNKSNNEYIVYLDHDGASYNGTPISQRNVILRLGGWQATQPTQDLVDAYEMTDGLDIQESPLYDEQNPYENRDPRFNATILHQGSIFKGLSLNFVIDEPGTDNTTYAYGPEATGYLLRKFVDESIANYNLPMNEHSSSMAEPILRFADVLLIYAEAQNESIGPDGSVYSAINRVRDRVDMPDLPEGLSQSEMRDRIRNERRVELAFEESRSWDIKRWKIATTVYPKPIPGIRVFRNAPGSPTEYTYERFDITDRMRNFQEKNYLFPIAQYELDVNPGIEQNPGY